MSAPTVWEEGRLPVSRVVRLAALAAVLVLALDVAVNGHLTALFDVAFVLVCLGAVLAVRPRDLASVALLPPALLVGVVGTLAAVETAWVARAGDGWVQALVSGITHRSTGLAVGYALVLLVILVRLRVRASRRTSTRPARPAARPTTDQTSKREGSPAPRRATSG